ncbi:alpha-L-rhamnosidase [Maribacter sp. ANRC-HE7]|uniref:alpha-L-rhamnosidase n=1 Tax=Maribacter aquimaris TaxID=2737171 RepID=A0ABR7V0I2_9FLAO|nr:alpha-L-rhamnosidase C-terminal domain-containing protein [Maribacter aquimaris]MBD0777424.1 alpha-L-rhamnosidase [Maribacter aquimaris]
MGRFRLFGANDVNHGSARKGTSILRTVPRLYFLSVTLTFLMLACKGKKVNDIVYGEVPVDLTVEYIRNTNNVLIVDDSPEFGWIVPHSAISQNAYQLLVASSEDQLRNDIGDVWDSGKVSDKQSSNVEYKGTPLIVGRTYYWKVKIWDATDMPSAFSGIQSFKIGKREKGITSANSLQLDPIRPITLKATDKSSYRIDFGKAAFATLQLKYRAIKKDTLVVRVGEQLINGRINRDPQGTIRYQEVRLPVNSRENTYILPILPDKRNTKVGAIALPDSVPVLMPFRYAEIEHAKEPIFENDVVQLAFHGYWNDNESRFQSSDTILDQVWDLCKYSIKATTFAGVYIDGDRERIPYEADAYLNQLSHYSTDREYAMARRTIEYFMEHPTWPTEWQLHVALMFHADYMYTGNAELIERYYEDLKYKTLAGLRRADGLISSDNATPEFMGKLGFKDPKVKLKDIVDWPPAQKDTGWKLATPEGERDGFVFTPINTVVNCMYYRNLEIMAEFAGVLDKADDVKFYTDLAKKVKTSINTVLFDPVRGVYVDGEGTEHASLHSNMMAMAFHIVPETAKGSVAKFIKGRGMACSVYGSQYLLEALYNAGEGQYALDLMTATSNRSWYNMIRIGSTMTLEAWDMKYKPNSDWNHAWGAVPANMVARGLWGINPKVPGYDIATIKPQLGSLKETSIIVPTIKGQIKAVYMLLGDTREFTIEIPGNMKAEFDVGQYPKAKIMLNGIKTENGTLHLRPGKNTILISH